MHIVMHIMYTVYHTLSRTVSDGHALYVIQDIRVRVKYVVCNYEITLLNIYCDTLNIVFNTCI